MTPQEKAKELIEKANQATSYKYQEYAGAHYTTFEHDLSILKDIALIAVEEIWNALESARVFEEYDYWNEVKQEIEKL
jgi:hypothetical protein